MRGKHLALATGLLIIAAMPAAQQVEAKSISFADAFGGAPSAPMPGVLQCVPFARDASGIRLYGDAHTWWRQAEGKYARGQAPLPGAVMAIRPHGGSSLGHVATVSRVIDARTILISHANWSAPGKIERNVTAVDVSPANNWSEVRVWYAPIGALGGAHWPVSGFIYNAKPGKLKPGKLKVDDAKLASLAMASAPAESRKATSKARTTTQTRFVPAKTVKVRFGTEPLSAVTAPVRIGPIRTAKQTASVKVVQARSAAPVMAPKMGMAPKVASAMTRVSGRRDPIGAILASNR